MIQDRNEILDELCERHIKNVLARELGRVLNDIEFMDGEDTTKYWMSFVKDILKMFWLES